MKNLTLFSLALCLLTSMSFSQKMQVPIDDISKVAGQSLNTLKMLVNESNYKQMGFASMEEPGNSVLGKPLLVYAIQLNTLREYKEGMELPELFTDEVIFPVLFKEIVRSSITVGKMGDKWETTSYGNPNRMLLLSRSVDNLQSDTTFKVKDFIVVKVPAMNLYFIGIDTKEILWLTPVLDEPMFDFKAGQPMASEEVLKRLAPVAREMEDVPR